MPPSRCSVTIAGYSFIVTVSAPNAPCPHTHTSVAAAHHGDAPERAERALRTATRLITKPSVISAPTAVAR